MINVLLDSIRVGMCFSSNVDLLRPHIFTN